MKLKGKVAILTGAGSGIGRATAFEFAKEGAKLVIADVNTTGGEATAKQVGVRGGEAKFVATDVANPKQVRKLVETAVRSYGAVHVLFNNAAVQIGTTVEATSLAEWDKIWKINVGGIFHCSKYCLPELRKTKGNIVNMASVNSYFVEPLSAAYCATKGAILALTQAMAMDHGPEGIRVNCICPGYIDTGLAEAYFRLQPDPDQARRQAGKLHALGRVGRPEEVARVAVFLASDEASFVTGSAYTVAGGFGSGLPLSE
jgi:NAD(P)-dependent dehydrogenase (short-subunit alcohol dehydrogenase family)